MNKMIIFYSPLNADIPAYKLGGAEAGCRRTLEVLKKIGYSAYMISKPTVNKGIRGYLKEILKTMTKVRCAMRMPDAGLFYMIGYYEKNIYLEYFILLLARRYGKRIIYEPKNGCMVNDYHSGSILYRYFQRKALRMADCVFCQGKEYVRFLKEEMDIEGIYIPNYVMDRYLQVVIPHKMNNIIQLFYWGRISPEKNIDLMIQISKKLKESGINNHLTLIGAYTDKYRKKLDQLIMKLHMEDNEICFCGNMSFDELCRVTEKADFFLFPSTNRTEGHSNALTEAMAFGIIPIASDAGFNRDVIGNNELIVNSLTADAYAKCIMDVLASGRAEELQHEMRARVLNHFTEKIITERVEEALKKLQEEVNR